jgi:Nuclease-related domain
MTSPRPWPFDDDDRPSGSVQPLSHADLQASLAHLNNDPDEQLAGTGADQPVVAIRVPASVGRPGGSAQARWRRMRAAEWAAWTRSLTWRVAAALGIGTAGGLLGSLLAPRLGLVLGALAAVAAGVGLGFRPSPDAIAGRRGAAGERRTARLLGPLERHGWVVLHDLAVPGSRANLDHLVIGPGWGVRGRLQTVSGPAAARRSWEAVAWPLSPCPHLAGGVLGGRSGRPGPARPRGGRGAHRGRPWRPGPLGQGRHGRGTGGDGLAPARHASSAPGRAGARAGRLAGRPGPGPLPRRRLTGNASESPIDATVAFFLPFPALRPAPGGGRDGHSPVGASAFLMGFQRASPARHPDAVV